jgi:hypothetical protein
VAPAHPHTQGRTHAHTHAPAAAAGPGARNVRRPPQLREPETRPAVVWGGELSEPRVPWGRAWGGAWWDNSGLCMRGAAGGWRARGRALHLDAAAGERVRGDAGAGVMVALPGGSERRGLQDRDSGLVVAQHSQGQVQAATGKPQGFPRFRPSAPLRPQQAAAAHRLRRLGLGRGVFRGARHLRRGVAEVRREARERGLSRNEEPLV